MNLRPSGGFEDRKEENGRRARDPLAYANGKRTAAPVRGSRRRSPRRRPLGALSARPPIGIQCIVFSPQKGRQSPCHQRELVGIWPSEIPKAIHWLTPMASGLPPLFGAQDDALHADGHWEHFQPDRPSAFNASFSAPKRGGSLLAISVSWWESGPPKFLKPPEGATLFRSTAVSRSSNPVRKGSSRSRNCLPALEFVCSNGTDRIRGAAFALNLSPPTGGFEDRGGERPRSTGLRRWQADFRPCWGLKTE